MVNNELYASLWILYLAVKTKPFGTFTIRNHCFEAGNNWFLNMLAGHVDIMMLRW